MAKYPKLSCCVLVMLKREAPTGRAEIIAAVWELFCWRVSCCATVCRPGFLHLWEVEQYTRKNTPVFLNSVKRFISRLRFILAGIPDIAAFFLHFRSHGGPYFFGEDSRKGNLEVALSGDLLSGIVLLVSTSYSWRGRLCVLRPALENTYSLWWMILYFKAGAC